MADKVDLSLTGQADPSDKNYYLIPIKGLVLGQQYIGKLQWSFEDSALNNIVKNIWSNGFAIDTNVLTAIAKPKLISTNVKRYQGRIEITWSGTDYTNVAYDAKAFKRINVYVRDNSTSPANFVGMGFIDQIGGTFSFPASPSSYTIRITAVSATGLESTWSDEFTVSAITDAPSVPSGLTAAWSGTTFTVSFTHDTTSPANAYLKEYIINLIPPLPTLPKAFPLTPTSGSNQKFSLSLEQNQAAFGDAQQQFTGTVTAVDIYNNRSAAIPFTGPAVVTELPVPVITAEPAVNGYSVLYTTPTSTTFDKIHIEEVVSNASTAPASGYIARINGSSNPLLYPAGTGKRWVRARFSDKLRLYTGYSNTVAVTPIDVVAAALDITPPTTATINSAVWSGNDIVISATVAEDAKKFIIRLTNGSTVGFFTKFPAVAGTSQTILLTEQELYNTLGSYFTSFSGLFVSADALDNRDAGVAFTVAQKTNPLLGVVPTFTLTAITNGYTATWVLPAGAAHAKVYERATSWGATNPVVGELIFSGQSPAIVKKTVYTTRYVKIEYLSTDGFTSSFSAEQTVTPIDAIAADVNAPSAPAVGATDSGVESSGTSGFNGYISLSWTAVSDPSLRGYRIKYRPYKISAPYENWSHASSSGTGTAYRLTGLATGAVYEIQIASYDEFNNTTEPYLSYPNVTVSGTPFIGENISTTGYFQAGVTGTDTGTFKFGYGVESGRRGLSFNANNYWYIDSGQTASLKIGGPSDYLLWDGNLTVAGNIRAKGGYFAGNIEMQSGASIWSGSLNNSGSLVGDGFLLNSSGLSIKKGTVNLRLDTSDGGIYAEYGQIAGWVIDSSKLERGSFTVGQTAGTGTYTGISSSGTYAIWAGSDVSAGNGTAKFSVTSAGAVIAKNITITGGSLTVGASSIAASTGKLISTDAEITGKITASTGKIGNLNIDSGALYTGTTPLVTSVTFNSGGIAGYNSSGTKMFGLDTSGFLEANSANINGWIIDGVSYPNQIRKTSGTNTIKLDASTATLEANGTGYTTGIGVSDASNIVMWAGASKAAAPFRVYKDGSVYASSLTIDGSTGFATTTALSTGLGTKIGASDVNTNVTSISGSVITSGVIKSGNFPGTNGQTANGAGYSTTGTAIDLVNGTITSKKFRIDTDGNAFFAGSLQAGTIITTPQLDGGTITGSSINIGPTGTTPAYNFSVDSNGALFANSATISGNITANALTINASNYINSSGAFSLGGGIMTYSGGDINIGTNFKFSPDTRVISDDNEYAHTSSVTVNTNGELTRGRAFYYGSTTIPGASNTSRSIYNRATNSYTTISFVAGDIWMTVD